MLEFLRHQTKPIMITLAAIIIIAFTFWGGYTQPGNDRVLSPEDTVLTVQGRDYSYAEVLRIQRGFQIAQDLRLAGADNYYVYELVGLQLNHRNMETGMPLSVSDAPVDYALNVIVLRNALEKYGIRASDSEVQQAFRSLGQFQVNGVFDRDRGLEFEKRLGTIGMRLSDVYEVIRDSLGFQKLQQVVAGNLVVSSKFSDLIYTSSNQTIKAATIPFVLDDFKKTVQVTDPEIGKYFEENKERYQSAEKRAVSYVLVEKPNTEGKNAEDTLKADNEFRKKLGDLALAVIAPGADFDAEVKKANDAEANNPKDGDAKKAGDADANKPKDAEPKKAKLEVKTLAAFSQDAPPAEIKDESEFIQAIFTNIPETHPVSDPVEVTKGYVIFKVTKVEKPAQQELKDVKDKVRDVLLGQKAGEAMQKAANDTKQKLEEAIKAGKKFDDVAKEAGLKPQILPEFSPSAQPTDLSNGREIAREAMDTPAGSLTKPLTTENGVILVHVISKELRKSEESATKKKNIANSLASTTQGDLFRAWFERRYQDAGIKADRLLGALGQ